MQRQITLSIQEASAKIFTLTGPFLIRKPGIDFTAARYTEEEREKEEEEEKIEAELSFYLKRKENDEKPTAEAAGGSHVLSVG